MIPRRRDTREDVTRLRRPEPVASTTTGIPGRILALQRTAGNAAVCAMIKNDGAAIGMTDVPAASSASEERTVTERLPFRATIAKVAPPPARQTLPSSQPGPTAAAGALTERDAPPGAGAAEPVLPPIPEGATDALASAGGAIAGAASAVAEGIGGLLSGAAGPEPGAAPAPAGGEAASDLPKTVALPDVILPGLDAIVESDKPVGGALTYSPTVTNSGGSPSGGEFGATSPYDIRMTGVTVTETATAFTVAGTVINPITYKIASPTGPSGQKDIDSDASATIKQSNYVAVADALKPNMSDLNGRPPRVGYYAKDLTERHELFHCTDGQTHARSGVQLAQAWLATQQAANIAAVQALVAAVPARVIATRQAAMTYPGREERAYGDGAPSYLGRSNAIRAKGVAGSYPA
jgi:hypothetical protein